MLNTKSVAELTRKLESSENLNSLPMEIFAAHLQWYLEPLNFELLTKVGLVNDFCRQKTFRQIASVIAQLFIQD